MNTHFSILFIALAIIFSAPVAVAKPPDDIQAEAQNSFIFQFSASASGDLAALAENLSHAYNGSLRHVFTNAINGFSATMSRANALKLVSENDAVSGFVNNGVAHAPGTGGIGGGNGGGNSGKGNADVQIQSWGVSVVGGSRDATADHTVRHAWIIDTGIDNYYAGSELNIGDGKNYVSKGKDTTDDTNGHGTHIAGILAAIDNDTGVLGIAAGATVHPVRVLHNNLWGTVDDIIAGVDYVAGEIAKYPSKDVHVINMSLTVEIATQEDTAAVLEGVVNAVADTGVKFAVCAGNSGADASLYTPANSSHPNVYTVAAIDSDTNLSSDSNYGAPPIDFVAPGVAIESLKPGGNTWFWSGCSMATPHVAGILLFAIPDGVENASGYALAVFP